VADHRRRLAANTFYSAVGVYAEYAAAFVVSVIVARRLGPADFGRYTLLMWIVLVAVSLANNGLLTGVMKFVGESRGGPVGVMPGILRHLERLQLASAAGVCGLGAAALAFAAAATARYVDDVSLLWVLIPAVLARSLYLFYLAASKGLEDFRAGARVHLSAAPVAIGIALVVAANAGTVRAFVYAYLITSLFYLVAMRVGVAGNLPASAAAVLPPSQRRRVIRHIGYASAIVALDLAVLRQPEIAFLTRFASAADVAHFGLGRSLAASAMILVPGVMTALLVPVMSRTFGEDPSMLPSRFLAATRYIVILVVPVVALCELFAGDLVLFLYGADYAPAVTVFRATVAAAAVGVVSASASSYQLSADRHPAIVAIMAAVACVTLALDYVLIRQYQLWGATAAAAASSVLLGVALLWHASAALRVSFQWPVYARVVSAGAFALIPAVVARLILPVWLAVPAGAILVVLSYAVASVLLRVWTRPDLEALTTMLDLLPSSIQPAAGRLLRRAMRTAPAGEGA
jgi:O-antigen/teichoic acid export membrane protein